MRKLALAVVCGAVLGGAILPAHAVHPTGTAHPTFRTETVYFHCAGANKVQNLGLLTDGTPGWNTTPPAGSYTAGNGCGAVDTTLQGTNQENIYDAVFRGTFTGNLQSMTVRMHNLLLSRARQGTAVTIRVRLSIDGEALFSGAAGKTVTVTPVVSSTGLTESFEFSIVNLGFANYVYDADGKLRDVQVGGLAKDEGDGETERSILITIDTPTAPSQSAWVWDATEIPSGITFNPATLAAAKITSPLPQGPPAE